MYDDLTNAERQSRMQRLRWLMADLPKPNLTIREYREDGDLVIAAELIVDDQAYAAKVTLDRRSEHRVMHERDELMVAAAKQYLQLKLFKPAKLKGIDIQPHEIGELSGEYVDQMKAMASDVPAT